MQDISLSNFPGFNAVCYEDNYWKNFRRILILIMHPISLIMYPPYCLPRQWHIDLFTVYDAILDGGQTRLKLQ